MNLYIHSLTICLFIPKYTKFSAFSECKTSVHRSFATPKHPFNRSPGRFRNDFMFEMTQEELKKWVFVMPHLRKI